MQKYATAAATSTPMRAVRFRGLLGSLSVVLSVRSSRGNEYCFGFGLSISLNRPRPDSSSGASNLQSEMTTTISWHRGGLLAKCIILGLGLEVEKVHIQNPAVYAYDDVHLFNRVSFSLSPSLSPLLLSRYTYLT